MEEFDGIQPSGLDERMPVKLATVSNLGCNIGVKRVLGHEINEECLGELINGAYQQARYRAGSKEAHRAGLREPPGIVVENVRVDARLDPIVRRLVSEKLNQILGLLQHTAGVCCCPGVKELLPRMNGRSNCCRHQVMVENLLRSRVALIPRLMHVFEELRDAHHEDLPGGIRSFIGRP